MRIANTLSATRERGRCALVVYLVAGDPSRRYTPLVMHALVEAGVDMIELGIPSTDPIADGPVIQAGHARAIRAGIGTEDVFGIVREFRARDPDTPIVLMGYTDPIEQMGVANFAEAAAKSGCDGTLVVDLPPEEARPLVRALRAQRIDPIFLIGGGTSDARISVITDLARGFLYYVSVRGVTGAGGLDPGAIAADLARVRARTTMPIAVGFGIRDAASAASVAARADAVVIGTVVVDRIARLDEQYPVESDRVLADLVSFVAEIRRAMER